MQTTNDIPFILHKLNTIGYKVCPPIPQRIFAQWALFYLISGEVLMESEKRQMLIKGHSYILVPPDIPFSINYYNNSIGYMGRFDENFLKDRNHKSLLVRTAVNIIVATEDQGFTDELMFKLFRSQNDIKSTQCALDMMLQQIDSDLPIAFSPNNKLCNDFLDLIFEKGKSILSVSTYAAMLGISANHLNRTVKANTGKSTGEWIDIARVTAAKVLLLNEKLSIIDIATEIGLRDQSYFARFFKKQTGLTPTEFRTNAKSKKA